MRVLQVPFSYYPSPVGGTEVYVAALVRHLQEHEIECVIAAPGDSSESCTWEGTEVYRFSVSEEPRLDTLYDEGDSGAAAQFRKILATVKPDLVHFHALTSGASVLAIRAAKSFGIPVVLTYHTPGTTCLRDTMMKWGSSPCNGVMDSFLCTACTLHGKGMPKPVSLALAALPAPALAWLGKRTGHGRVATLLQLPALTRLRHKTTRTAFALADAIVAVCNWVVAVLQENAVPEQKLSICRQGLPGNIPVFQLADSALLPQGSFTEAQPLRLVFFGRLDANKGLHVIIRAIRNKPSLPLVLDIYGIAQGEAGLRYRQELLILASTDSRIRFCSPQASAAVPDRMRQYHLVVIPSQWQETGPLVVYEAYAAGVPVIGKYLRLAS